MYFENTFLAGTFNSSVLFLCISGVRTLRQHRGKGKYGIYATVIVESLGRNQSWAYVSDQHRSYGKSVKVQNLMVPKEKKVPLIFPRFVLRAESLKFLVCDSATVVRVDSQTRQLCSAQLSSWNAAGTWPPETLLQPRDSLINFLPGTDLTGFTTWWDALKLCQLAPFCPGTV